MDKDNCGCTPPPVVGVNGHWECTPIPDGCKPVELTNKLIKEMYEKNVNTEAFTTVDKAKLNLLHEQVGGGTGVITGFVKEVVAGRHILIDSTDPTKPIVSTDGVSGPQGVDGPQGPAGSKGSTGLQGPAGLQGPKGDDGISWHLSGRDTEANIMKKTGVPGDMWIVTEPANAKDGHAFGWDPTLQPSAGWRDMGQFKGDKGNVGAVGAVGAKGGKGDAGIQGVAGPKGPQGVIGPIGPKGDTGAKGVAGGQGIQGTKGDKGDAGKNGTGITVKGSKANEAAVKLVTGSTAGDMWLAQDTGHGWVSDGATPTVWTDAGNIQGPKGDVGTAGPQGVKGSDGTQGIQGLKGDTGPSGTDGADGHQGIKGDTGTKGDTGSIGITGPAGLKGDSGPVGPKGAIGPQGVQGPQGTVGPKGAAGTVATISYASSTEVADGIVTDKAVSPATSSAIYMRKNKTSFNSQMGANGFSINSAGIHKGILSYGVGLKAITLGNTKAGSSIYLDDTNDVHVYTKSSAGKFDVKGSMLVSGSIESAAHIKGTALKIDAGGKSRAEIVYDDTLKSTIIRNTASTASVGILDNGDVTLDPKAGSTAKVNGYLLISDKLSVMGNATIHGTTTVSGTLIGVAGVHQDWSVGRASGGLCYLYNYKGKNYIDVNDTGDINITPSGTGKAKVKGKNIVTGTLSGTVLSLTL